MLKRRLQLTKQIKLHRYITYVVTDTVALEVSFDRTSACDRQTDRQTRDHSIYGISRRAGKRDVGRPFALAKLLVRTLCTGSTNKHWSAN